MVAIERRPIIALAAPLSIVALLAGCAAPGDPAAVSPAATAATAPSSAAPSPTAAAAAAPVDDAAALAASLQFIIEEEKLAHDVYVELGAVWGLHVFDSISESELRHQEAVADLLAAFAIADPRLEAVGSFSDPVLQALHDELVASGSASASAAAEVGVAIEQKDIVDLQAILDTAPPSEVVEVLQRLLDGSTRHLEAFERQV